MNILVVDDDEASLEATRIALSERGAEVSAMVSARDAVSALEKGAFDWLVTDIRMNSMTGFELAARAKRLHPRIRVVMVSGAYGERDIKGKPIERAFVKPVDPDELWTFLNGGVNPEMFP